LRLLNVRRKLNYRYKYRKARVGDGKKRGQANMQADTTNGSGAAVGAANMAANTVTAAVNSQAQSSRRDQARATGPAANTAKAANDSIAYLQMLSTLLANMSEVVDVRLWQAKQTEDKPPTVLIAVFMARQCPNCHNLYPSNESCGICSNTAN
jgi:hypothetical protein